MPLHIKSLYSAGIITNYHCSASCAHCLYASSPKRQHDYMTYDTAKEIISYLKSRGMDSIHIGGGEPFLNIDGLYDVLSAAQSENMHIVYLETNSSWYQNHDKALDILHNLMKLGLDTLLLSVDPFHNEYIDFSKVKGVMKACEQTGMGTFLWQRKYFPYVEDIGSGKHTLSEYNKKYGDDFLENAVMSYGMSANGRAINLLSKFVKKRSLDMVLSDSCPELAVADDFHIDLYKMYTPPRCVGLGIHLDDLDKPLDKEKYALINILYDKGVRGLLDYAKIKGFTPNNKYLNKCELCLDIRKYLLNKTDKEYFDIAPKGFYDCL